MRGTQFYSTMTTPLIAGMSLANSGLESGHSRTTIASISGPYSAGGVAPLAQNLFAIREGAVAEESAKDPASGDTSRTSPPTSGQAEADKSQKESVPAPALPAKILAATFDEFCDDFNGSGDLRHTDGRLGIALFQAPASLKKIPAWPRAPS